MDKPRKARTDSVTSLVKDAQRTTANHYAIPEPFRLNPEQAATFHQLTTIRDSWDDYSIRLLATAAQLLHDRQLLYRDGIKEPMIEGINGAMMQNPLLKLATSMNQQICQIFMRLGLKETALKLTEPDYKPKATDAKTTKRNLLLAKK